MAGIVHRHAPGKRFAPAFPRALRRAFDVENIRHEVVIDARLAVLTRPVHGDAVVGFLRRDGRDIPVEAELGEARFSVGERHMHLIDAILQRAEIIAVANVTADIDLAFCFQLGIVRKRRRGAFAEVGKDQPEKFMGRTTAYS